MTPGQLFPRYPEEHARRHTHARSHSDPDAICPGAAGRRCRHSKKVGIINENSMYYVFYHQRWHGVLETHTSKLSTDETGTESGQCVLSVPAETPNESREALRFFPPDINARKTQKIKSGRPSKFY